MKKRKKDKYKGSSITFIVCVICIKCCVRRHPRWTPWATVTCYRFLNVNICSTIIFTAISRKRKKKKKLKNGK